MSLTEPPRSFGRPPPKQAYPYAPAGIENTNTRAPQPMLPPMSSLLPRHELMAQGPSHNTYPPRSFPPSQEPKHPLWLSEMDPSAPVQHIYHPPQPTTQSPPYQPQPFLVPSRSPENIQYPIEVRQTVPQPRQSRKISQRRYDTPKNKEEGNIRSPVHDQFKNPRPPQTMSPFQRNTNSSPASSQHSSGSMPISGLLSDTPRSAPPQFTSNLSTHSFSAQPNRTPPKYSIRMRQQPLAARACGFGERDRRVIDPPPILQMAVDAPNATLEELSAMIRQPCAVVHCTLWDPVANRDDTAMPGTTDKRQQRRLMGTLVSSPFVGLDEHDVEGCFFTFPDLSVRTPGTYSLRFSLMIIDPMQMKTGHSVPVSSVVYSDAFHVYNAKDFGGMRASTELTKRLKHQGCLISVKKGNAKPGGSNSRDDDDDDDDEEDDGDGDEKKKRQVKKAKR
ncbi:hypothetical protein G7Y89_g15332 [Cudoniella acicularis]|uniref:Velvet domain-containing protein n=1 Tax=Cudoniella acicularis TaxID=354080 RepID=A0A8H4QNG5_9HELO|nr:hypothetical protein G7Y89_g15332 [Cudoniella acicularis]